MNHIHIVDTTLRDGGQAPGVAFSLDEKLTIARMLDDIGVHEIECGIPAMGEEEQHAVRRIVNLGLGARIMTWNRAVISDIEASLRCGVSAVAISLPVSNRQIANKLGKTREWVLERLEHAVRFAKEHQLSVCVGAEDASRADHDFLVAYASVAQAAGADRIRFSDTVGRMDPFHLYDRVSGLMARVDLPVEIHTHNDFGMATANALAGVRAGAAFVSTTVLGIGERAGAAALEEVAMALNHLHGADLGLRFSLLPDLCRYVARASGREIPPDKPIVGSAIFWHESEIHAGAVLTDPGDYEPYPPEKLGRSREIVLGTHSGRRAVSYRLGRLGITREPEEVNHLVKRVRSLSGRVKRVLSDEELMELCR